MKYKLLRITTYLSLIIVITMQTKDLQLGISNLLRGGEVLGTALAVGGLTVDWGVPEGDPIFVVNSAAPGDTETRAVEITNGDVVTLPIAVKGLNLISSSGLESVLELTIRRGVTDVYGGTSPTGPKTLADFMSDSSSSDGVALGNINAGQTLQYSFELHFQEDAGNEYQNTSVQFDLVIGIAIDIPEECSFIDLDGKFPIFGTSGNDRINGTTGDDVIFGFAGNDRIFSHGGNDCIIGGEGNDEARGETGNDVIFGNEGNDKLIGAVGVDLIFGGTGDDNIRAEDGNDTVWGDAGEDDITGGNGNDTIDGGADADEIDGDNGNDIINGGVGNDEIDGGAGNDTIHGNEGNDEIDAKAGNDTVVGDTGTDSANGHSGFDTCTVEIPKNCES